MSRAKNGKNDAAAVIHDGVLDVDRDSCSFVERVRDGNSYGLDHAGARAHQCDVAARRMDLLWICRRIDGRRNCCGWGGGPVNCAGAQNIKFVL